MSDEVRAARDYAMLVESVAATMGLVADMVHSAMAKIAPAVESFWQLLRDNYHDAGSPYGDTEDGLLRWVREQGALSAAEREAEYQRERTQMYMDLRARLGLAISPVQTAGEEANGQ